MTEPTEVPRPDKRRVLNIDATIWAVTVGLLSGIGLFIATNVLVLRGGEAVGKHLGLLRHYFIGYRVTFLGSLIGFAYAFAVGFVATWIFVRVYNWVAQRRQAGH